MILRSSPASPFGRKVSVAADIAGLSGQVSVVIADTGSETDSLRRENPLGKIPTLILDDGTVLFDSAVILEFLDHLAGPGTLIPVDPVSRFRSLTLQALADGIADAALLGVYEGRWRPEEARSAKWLDYQAAKVERGLAAVEAAPPTGRIDAGHIALACALGYLDLRFAGRWRENHPALVKWLAAFAQTVPAFEKTAVRPT